MSAQTLFNQESGGGVGPDSPYFRNQRGVLWTAYKALTPTAWTGQTSYTANGTTPTLLLHKSAGVAFTIPQRLDISQSGTVAGSIITCIIKEDAANRFSSGGNSWLLRNMNNRIPSATVPEFLVKDSATATSEAAADVRTIFEGTIFQTVTSASTGFIFDFEDKVILTANGSLLIYLFATGTGPTFNGTLTVLEHA